MLRVKRTKRVGVVVAVHYATGIAKPGYVTGLDSDPAKAAAINDAAAERVKAYYASRPAFGELAFEEVMATAEQLAKADASEQALAAEDTLRLQGEVLRLKKEVFAARDETEAAIKGRQGAEAKIVELSTALKAEKDEVVRLNARVTELEELATRPKPTPAPSPKPNREPRPSKAAKPDQTETRHALSGV